MKHQINEKDFDCIFRLSDDFHCSCVAKKTIVKVEMFTEYNL
jgi:hypothetical protein